ncbi:unnamed protein product [Rotaria magnacalcarata]|uniref:LisH domain-containing protein n=6 Tax=Rotaria magnacalcarata TaxID=392030 RepID=A0A816PKN1_9BILA|nr:unnamed protein product [Rotaria magnacalcarata]CAF2049008.1 unnamed protein product [Rotaria magnacalcarata]CAF2077101.1 unnamed protein product [Rotaria magnacalcarata]CAF2088011.1 unnamed protein product [Rotaria magnacalcarata]CAF3724108.1 unnamed protein product [Rotaria magnacalcarata]
MYGKNKGVSAPSDMHAKEKLNLYVYEYLYHIGAVKAAQGFCADMKWEPSKMSLGEAPGFLFSWWCVFWDLYSAAPERREQHPHSEEAKAFHDYGFINSNYAPNGIPPQQNPNPNAPQQMPMNVNEGMHNPNVPFFPPPGQPMMNPYPRYPNAPPPPRPLVRMPSQPDYSGGPNGGALMPPQMDGGRNGLRMTSPGTRLPPNPMGHTGPGGPPPPNAYRPQGMPPAMSPSMNQGGPRMFMTNSPGVGGYSSSSPVSYGTQCPTGHAPTTPMMSSPQDSNGGEMPPYGMRNMSGGMPPGPNPMYHDPHLTHMSSMQPDMSHHGSINGDYDQQMKQSPGQQQQQQTQPPPSDVPNFNYGEDQVNDTTAILKLKESMQEEVKKFDKTPNSSNNDDYNHFSGIG